MSLEYVAMLAYARETARQTADYIIDMARSSAEPVVFVTGNSYMPPARSFAGADEIYEADPDLWDLYWDLVESALSDADVMTACPDYDNSIYAVDLTRWQYREDVSADDLNGEWEPVSEQDYFRRTLWESVNPK